jgi:hypothetical protein
VNIRVALIIGSTLAAMIVSGALAWFMRSFDSEPALQGAVWIIHFRITLPAMIAVALSAVWHTRGTCAADCPEATLSARIAWWSFPVFGVLLALMQFIEMVVLADATEGYVGSIMISMAAIFVITMIASIFLFIPAFFVELVVVRFSRASWLRALMSGVAP